MLKVGLTGGLASGKSVVGGMFVELGAHLLQADSVAHELMEPGQSVYDEVVSHFGRGVLEADGSINRRKLAEAAFGNVAEGGGESCLPALHGPASRIEELNRIVHPAVIRRQGAWLEEMEGEHPQGVAMVEAALILEAGAVNQFDRLVVVTCDDEQRVARFAARQKISVEDARKEVRRRMAAQMPEEEKIKAADYVIDNSKTLEHTRERVRQVWEHLQRGMA